MNTPFPKFQHHIPKYFLLNAQGKTLGRLACEISKLLRSKDQSYFTPGIDQGNYVILINAQKIIISGKKSTQKYYYRNSQRPGNLKKENYQNLQKRFPSRILERAVYGMLPKGALGRKFYKRLFVYGGSPIFFKNSEKFLFHQKKIH